MNEPLRSVRLATVARPLPAALTRTNETCARRRLDATLTVSLAPGERDVSGLDSGHVTCTPATTRAGGSAGGRATMNIS